MTITAVINRMARLGYDVHLTIQHNGWVHLSATFKNTGTALRDADGALLTASAPLYADAEYNVMATFDAVAYRFWKQWGKFLETNKA